MYVWSVVQSCPNLCDPIDYSPPGSSVLGIFKARILEPVAISFTRGSSRPRDGTHIFCIAGGLGTRKSNLRSNAAIVTSSKPVVLRLVSMCLEVGENSFRRVLCLKKEQVNQYPLPCQRQKCPHVHSCSWPYCFFNFRDQYLTRTILVQTCMAWVQHSGLSQP